MRTRREGSLPVARIVRITALIVALGVAFELATLASPNPSGFLVFMAVGLVTVIVGVLGFYRLLRR